MSQICLGARSVVNDDSIVFLNNSLPEGEANDVFASVESESKEIVMRIVPNFIASPGKLKIINFSISGLRSGIYIRVRRYIQQNLRK